MEMPPPAPVITRLGGTSDLLSLMKPKAQSMADSEGSQFFSACDELEEPQQLLDSVTVSITVASILPVAPVSIHDHRWDFPIDDNSTTLMAELSLGREAPPLSPSILVVEGDMPSTSPGKGSSTSPEIPTTDVNVYSVEKLHSYLDIAGQCLVRVQEMPSRRFNNEQCGYLVGKLQVILQSANLFLGNNLKAQPEVKHRTSEDMIRCTEVFKLLLALALKIEIFIQGCCKDEWLQAAMTLTNTAEYVSSLGFNLELCQFYFSFTWTATTALTAAQVDSIDRNEVDTVKWKASRDVDVLLDTVISELHSLRGEDKDLGIYLLQRLKRVKPASTSLSPESPFWSVFDDLGFMDRTFQMVRQAEVLGKGTSATVYKALWFGIPVAKKTFYGREDADYVREAQILVGLFHPNIMSLFCWAMDKRKCSIVMELMDEDLNSFMERRLDANPHSPPFSVLEAVDVILQIGEGVNYLHENGIVHRDLKSFNILVKNVLPPDLEVQYVLIKVSDFGFAKIKESSTRYSNQTLNIGTNRWMPPEVINLHNTDGQTSSSVLQAGPKYPKKSDVYSFGMVCYEILTGDLPFPHETSLFGIKKKVLKGERPTLPDYCPSKLKALIEACWDPEPSNRPSFASICSALKHLKCLLISGFNSNDDSLVQIGEVLRVSLENTPFEAPTREMVARRSPDICISLPMSPENTPFEAPTREMVVQKRPVQGGLVKSLFTIWRRPLRIFISHAGGPNGSGKNFPSWLHQSLMRYRWSRSKFHVEPFLDVENCAGGLISGKILKELARFDVGVVVVTSDFFERHWPMKELIKFVEAQRNDGEGRIRVLPLFYDLTPDEVKQGLDDGKWESFWVQFSAANYPLELQECRDAVKWLCQQTGIRYISENRDYDKAYIDTILRVVDEILCNERSFAADVRWARSLLRRNKT